MLAIIIRSILLCDLRSTRKLYIMKFFFPLILTLRYIFVIILLSMTFIYISISLKTSNILANKSQVFERSDCTIT